MNYSEVSLCLDISCGPPPKVRSIGMFRGSKHWPLSDQKRIWSWFEPKMQGVLNSITPDTQVSWEMFVSFGIAT